MQEDPRMKALVGSWDQRPYQLLAEITALRTRVAELQAQLAGAREENAILRQLLRTHDVVPEDVVPDDLTVVAS
jgi:hypothetical protein